MAKKSVEPIRSVAELAKLVGRDRGTVGRWTKRSDWKFGAAPWPAKKVPEILRWAANHLGTRSDVEPLGSGHAARPAKCKQASPESGAERVEQVDGPVEDMVALREAKIRQEVRKLRTAADLAEVELAKNRGQLLDANAVEMEFATIGVKVRAGCEGLAARVVSQALTYGLPHDAAPDYRLAVDEAIADVLRRLSRDEPDDHNETDDDGPEAAA